MIFVPKMWFSDAETIKNEENAKFYTSLCLDTLFCQEFVKKYKKIQKSVKTKKNEGKPPPQLMKRTL